MEFISGTHDVTSAFVDDPKISLALPGVDVQLG